MPDDAVQAARNRRERPRCRQLRRSPWPADDGDRFGRSQSRRSLERHPSAAVISRLWSHQSGELFAVEDAPHLLRVWCTLLGRCPDRLIVAPIKLVALVAREDVNVEMPDVLAAGRLVVLASRCPFAPVCHPQRDGDVLGSSVDRR
jgi:hypothetical protein